MECVAVKPLDSSVFFIPEGFSQRIFGKNYYTDVFKSEKLNYKHLLSHVFCDTDE